MIIGIDFDGTIADHCFPSIGEPVPGAFTWMKHFQTLGAKLVLWTMRSDGEAAGGNYLSAAVAFCRRHGVEFWGVNRNPEQGSWTSSPKLYANCYVDDAAIGCPLLPPMRPGGKMVVDWAVVGPMVEKLILSRRKS